MLEAEALTHLECLVAFIETIWEVSPSSRVSQVLVAPVCSRCDSALKKASRVSVAKVFSERIRCSQ
jgi:hypothetical protein